MLIRVLSSTLVGGVWHEPGVGNYSPGLAEHLIGLGVAEPVSQKLDKPIETKVVAPTEKKSQSSASQPGQVSRKKTATRSKGKK